MVRYNIIGVKYFPKQNHDRFTTINSWSHHNTDVEIIISLTEYFISGVVVSYLFQGFNNLM